LLVLARLPEPPPALPPALTREDAPPQQRALAHYARFVEEGGTLLVLGAAQNELAELEEGLALACLAPLEFRAEPFIGGPLVLPDGMELEFEERPAGTFTGAHGALLCDLAGRAVGALQPCGAGRVALLALPAERFDNAHLAAEPDHALLLVRMVEALAPIERLAFDEYALGGWRPTSVPALALRPRLQALSLHVFLFLLVLVWRSAWSGPFARDPAPERSASALARAHGFGRLLARAGRHDLLAGFLRRAWIERGATRCASAADGFDRALAELAGGDERRWARLRASLEARTITSEAELDSLARDLDQLEDELAQARRTPTRP
jgi:hypothetical protein